jgi:hypothetical protein
MIKIKISKKILTESFTPSLESNQALANALVTALKSMNKVQLMKLVTGNGAIIDSLVDHVVRTVTSKPGQKNWVMSKDDLAAIAGNKIIDPDTGKTSERPAEPSAPVDALDKTKPARKQ